MEKQAVAVDKSNDNLKLVEGQSDNVININSVLSLSDKAVKGHEGQREWLSRSLHTVELVDEGNKEAERDPGDRDRRERAMQPLNNPEAQNDAKLLNAYNLAIKGKDGKVGGSFATFQAPDDDPERKYSKDNQALFVTQPVPGDADAQYVRIYKAEADGTYTLALRGIARKGEDGKMHIEKEQGADGKPVDYVSDDWKEKYPKDYTHRPVQFQHARPHEQRQNQGQMGEQEGARNVIDPRTLKLLTSW